VKASKTYEEALQLVSDGLMTKVSAVLMVPREEMDQSRAYCGIRLGLAGGIEIRNWIIRELEASLQVLELLTSSSITALAETTLKKSRLADFKEGKEGAELRQDGDKL
jgi:hypothetical protein